MTKGLSIIVFVIFVLSLISPIISGNAQTDARALFEARCSLCHGIDRPTSTKKSREGWESTVMRMKAKPGAAITDEEAEKIVDYLVTHYGK